MSTATIIHEPPETLADLCQRLGDVPLQRVRFHPAPGTAGIDDVVAAMEAPQKRLCELVDGVLVEKDMGASESRIAMELGRQLGNFLEQHALGFILGADGPLEILPDLVRIPDLSFVSWDQLPGQDVPEEPVPNLVPDLAVEVLSKGNTPAEMDRKLQDYFAAGTQMVWYIDPRTQTAEIYTSPANRRRIPKHGSLDGGNILPGFRLPLRKLFERPGKSRKKGNRH